MRQVSFVCILLLGGIIAGASLSCFPMDSDSTPLLNYFSIETQPGVALKLVCQYEESGNCTYVGGSRVAGKSSCPGGLSSAGTVNNPGIKSTTRIFPSKTLPTFPTTTATETSSSSKLSVPGGVFAGIAVGIVTVLVFLGCVVFIYRRQIHNRVRVDAVFHPELTARRAVTENTQGFRTDWGISMTQARDARSNISSLSAEIRQEYLRNRMLAAQRQLDALPDMVGLSSPATEHSGSHDEGGAGALDQATQQIQALQLQIHALKLQLQSQWALGLSDDPPPGYLE
ncbi:hypothetical protein DFH09DRAFT_1153018 [Mycena vulgaris]|nr:hypothetical protein DFH09DRAFT_1153018 [Mycena vulgaris]